MDSSLFLLVLIVLAALGFGFSNGLNDAANAIATVIGSRVLPPRTAIAMASVFNLLGTLTGGLLGAFVARTIGKGIVMPEALTLLTVVAAVAAATLWVVAASYYGMPLSVSHSLIAALLGAGLAAAGAGAVVWGIFTWVLLAVFFAPLLGFFGSFLLMVLVMWIFRRTPPDRVNTIFSYLQIFAAAFVAYAHGKNDGQMPIGIIALGLVLYTGAEFHVPLWSILASAAAVALGISFGGWRVIRTVGTKITTLRPVHGSVAETSAAAIIEAASNLGIPVSTTQSISGSVMGVGATRRLSAVRWGVARNIMMTWLVTFPACIGLGWVLSSFLNLFA
ncbi:MAG: inorganic phosphate transporter [Dehalococcoidia bacterium]|nr:inorganic phosphate transporter [Dehalococcoidia bacterium]